MIKYFVSNEVFVYEALEALAYRVLRFEHPTWHSIPEEDIAQLLREEGVGVYVAKEEY